MPIIIVEAETDADCEGAQGCVPVNQQQVS